MVLRIIHSSNTLPISYPCDISSVFQGGMIAQATLMGNNIVFGTSSGEAPFGIIDDIRTTSFYSPAIDETHVVPVVGAMGGDGRYRSLTDVTELLNNSNILTNSFVCDIPIYLREKNGAVIIPAGTELNYSQTGGLVDSIKFVCSYTYQVSGIAGDDSTIGSGRITIWYGKMIFETDQFESSQRYALNAPLFCNESGYLTTRQVTPTHPVVGMVLGPPSARLPSLQALWF